MKFSEQQKEIKARRIATAKRAYDRIKEQIEKLEIESSAILEQKWEFEKALKSKTADVLQTTGILGQHPWKPSFLQGSTEIFKLESNFHRFPGLDDPMFYSPMGSGIDTIDLGEGLELGGHDEYMAITTSRSGAVADKVCWITMEFLIKYNIKLEDPDLTEKIGQMTTALSHAREIRRLIAQQNKWAKQERERALKAKSKKKAKK